MTKRMEMSQPMRRRIPGMDTLLGWTREWLADVEPRTDGGRGTDDRDRHHTRGSTHHDDSIDHLVEPRQPLLDLLEEHGGRMEQSAIVEATEWAESTISRKLTTLESDGAIVRYRIGRGKMVYLPDEEPEAFTSPFDESEPSPSVSS